MSARGEAAARHVDVLGSRVDIAPWLLDDLGRIVRDRAPAHTIAVISDQVVGELHAPHVVGSLTHFGGAHRVIYRAIPSGERHKTREWWGALTDWLIDERCGRDTTVVALGGGVIGDLAGFVAATFMRGIPFVQAPTTLLAMVDASVGGKVAVDTAAGKNLVGAFHQPAAVAIDPTVLQTLPVAQLRAGLAEVIKHGIICDAEYFTLANHVGVRMLGGDATAPPTRDHFDWHTDELAALITRSVEIKAAVVRADEREAGVRRILNFGHTIGHAVEIASDFTLLHGEAVAIGMSLEATLAERLGIARPGLAAAVEGALVAVGLPTRSPPELAARLSAERVFAAMGTDKKSRRGRLVFALPSEIGRMAGADDGFAIACPDADVTAILKSLS